MSFNSTRCVEENIVTLSRSVTTINFIEIKKLKSVKLKILIYNARKILRFYIYSFFANLFKLCSKVVSCQLSKKYVPHSTLISRVLSNFSQTSYANFDGWQTLHSSSVIFLPQTVQSTNWSLVYYYTFQK